MHNQVTQSNPKEVDWDLPTRAPSMESLETRTREDRTAYNSRAPSLKSHNSIGKLSSKTKVEECEEQKSPDKSKDESSQSMDQANYLPTRQVIIVYLSLCIGLFSSFLDQTIVAAAIPSITSALGGSKESSWLSTGYLVASTSLQPVWGRISDITGRKLCFLIALSLFSLGNLLAITAATTLQQVIIFRALAGLGGGAVQSLVLIIVSDIVPLKKRGNYQGLIGLFNALGNAIGPLVGGSLAQSPSLGWKAVFLVSLPLNALCGIVTVFFLPLKPPRGSAKEKLKRIDYGGTILVSSGTILLLLGLNWGGLTYSWDSPQVLVPICLSVLLLSSFLFWEWKIAPFPIIPLGMFKNLTVTVVMISQFSGGVAQYVLLFMIPQLLQTVKGFDGVKAGIALIPLTVLQSAGSAFCGYLVTKLQRYKMIVLSGFAIYALGIGLLINIKQDPSLEIITVYCIIAGLGSGACTQTQLLAAQSAVPRQEMAVVTSARNFFRLLGGTLGLAFSYLILNIDVTSVESDALTEEQILSDPTILFEELDLDPSLRQRYLQAYLDGFRHIFAFVTAFLLLALLLSTFGMREHPLSRKDDEELEKKGEEFIKQTKLGGKNLDLESQIRSPKEKEEGEGTSQGSVSIENADGDRRPRGNGKEGETKI